MDKKPFNFTLDRQTEKKKTIIKKRRDSALVLNQKQTELANQGVKLGSPSHRISQSLPNLDI